MDVAWITILRINMFVQILIAFPVFYIWRAKLNGMGERHINGTVQKAHNIADGLTVNYRSSCNYASYNTQDHVND